VVKLKDEAQEDAGDCVSLAGAGAGLNEGDAWLERGSGDLEMRGHGIAAETMAEGWGEGKGAG